MSDNNNYLYLAKSDLKSAEYLVNINPQTVPSLCTQAIEKILKHYIIEYGYLNEENLKYMKGHNLKKLARTTDLDCIEPYIVYLTDLTDYYFDTSYPGETYIDITYEDANTIFKKTEEIFNLILKEVNNKEIKLLNTTFNITDSTRY